MMVRDVLGSKTTRQEVRANITARYGNAARLLAHSMVLRHVRSWRDRSEADMPRASGAGRSDENDPSRMCIAAVGRTLGNVPVAHCYLAK
jgi:hypothetical protein